MSEDRRQRSLGYLVAVVAAAAAGLLRGGLDPLLGDHLPYVIFFAAILVTVWYGGLRPALLATALGGVLAAYFFVPPRKAFPELTGPHGIGMILYVLLGLALAILGGAMRIAQDRARIAEDLARREREMLRNALAKIGDAVVTTDAQGKVTHLNGMAQELTGWKLEEALGRPSSEVFRIVHEKTGQPVDDPVEKVLELGKAVRLANHTVLLRKDGLEHAIEDSAAPIRNDGGQIVGVVLVFQDITERKTAERAIHHRERELVDFIENAVFGLHWVGPDGTILRANQAELDLVGHPAEDYVGRNIATFHTDPTTSADLLQRLRAGEKIQNYPARLRCKDGSIKDVLIDSSVYLQDGRFVHARCVTRDVTDRKQAELLLAGQNRILELIATGAPLADVLGALAGVIEEQDPGLLCSILPVSETGRSFTAGVGPSLPGDYLRTLEGTEIGPPYFSPWSMAADLGRAVIVLDIDTDTRWCPTWRIRASQVGLRACLATPIFASDSQVLATFALYRRQAGDPEPANPQLVEVATHLAGIALERHHSEGRIREREAQLRLVTDIAPVLLAHFDSQRKFKFVNRTYAERFGKRPEEVIGRHLAEVVGEAVYSGIQHHTDAALAGNTVEFETNAVFERDGTQFMRVAYVPERDTAGRVVGVVTVIVNITDRKRTEEALRENEATLRAFYDHSPVFMGVVEPTSDGDVLHIYDNPPSCRFFGVRPGETANRRALADLGGSPRVVTEWLAHYRQSEQISGPVRFEHQFEASSGTRWLAATVCPIGPGPTARTRFCYIAEDVTIRRLAEESLRDSEQRFRQLADAMPQIVYETAVNGRVEFCNRQWYTYTGMKQADTSDLPWVVHPADLEGLVGQWKVSMATEAPLAAEFRLKRAVDGQWRWFLTRAVPIRDEEGRLVKWYGTSTDIHEMRLAQEALREADRRKDDFLALLAHELRNPLAPLRNGLGILGLAGVDSDVVGQARSMMDRQLSQLVRIVDDLLDVSRITRNKMELRKDRIDLAAVIQSAVETSRPVLEERGHRWTVSLPNQPISLEADMTRMAQVFANLLNNSAKYTPPGGHIRLEAQCQEREVVVTVSDTGVGIPCEALGKIFDMFSQVDRALEKTTGGLGIGLSLVKGLVEMHGGSVEASSEGTNRGSTFTVRLPVAKAAPVAGEGLDEGKMQTRTPQRRILVVDDNRDSATSMALLLQLIGNEVRMAHDGLEAVQAAETFRPDLILMDVGMPRLNGLDATRIIRKQAWGKSIVVVALTGWGQEGDRKRTAEAGCDGHLVKPMDPAALDRLLAGLQSMRGEVGREVPQWTS